MGKLKLTDAQQRIFDLLKNGMQIRMLRDTQVLSRRLNEVYDPKKKRKVSNVSPSVIEKFQKNGLLKKVDEQPNGSLMLTIYEGQNLESKK